MDRSRDAADAPAPGCWHPLMVVPLMLVAWVYHPILWVDFYADDFAHLAHIESSGAVDFLLAPFGGHNYLARNLVFLASWEIFGLRAPLYFATVLATHLVNVALIFSIVRVTTGRASLACFGAALWGTLPLCLGALGWYSVYGHVLAATILLVLLDRLGRLAASHVVPSAAELGVWYGLLLVGTTCFGVGVGIAVAFPVVVFLIVPTLWSQPRIRVAWLLLPFVTIALYFGFRRLYWLVGIPTIAEALHERMALSGFAAVPPMLAHLLSYAVAGSGLGFFLPRTYPSVASGLVMVAFLLGLGAVFVRERPATRRLAGALVVLAGAIYLVIAGGRGHSYALFNVTPAKAAAVARYHYAGSIPVVILWCLVLREFGRLPGFCRVPGPLVLAGGLAAIAAGPLLVGLTVPSYRHTREYVRESVEAIVTGVRAWRPGSTAYVENDTTPLKVRGASMPNTTFPGRAGVFVLVQRGDQLEGRTVRFVERDPQVLQYYAERPTSRLARLLVSPEQVPSSP